MSHTRREALDVLERGHEALRALFEQLTSKEKSRSSTIGGGEWSAKDLQSHIAFWEELALKTIEARRSGLRPAVEEILTAGSGGVDAANAGNKKQSDTQSANEVTRIADAVYSTLMGTIEAMSDEEWNAASDYPNASKADLGELLGNVLAAPAGPFEHVSAHLGDLEAYVESLRGRPGRL